MSKRIAPWTDEEVTALNDWQQNSRMQFTCGAEEVHRAKFGKWPEWHCKGLLVATNQGWYCPKDGCCYTQSWAHEGMFHKQEDPEEKLRKQLFPEGSNE